jgi:ethanolamine utilization protein EutQ (cupin superfamily)
MSSWITKEILNSLTKDKPNSEVLAQRIAKLENIKLELQRLNGEKEQAKKTYQLALQKISRNEESYRKDCSHPHIIKHHDPSGGSDSFHECVICKKTWDNSIVGYDG